MTNLVNSDAAHTALQDKVERGPRLLLPVHWRETATVKMTNLLNK